MTASLFVGEDMILVPLAPGEGARYAERARAAAPWRDVVPGLADCALRFDPALIPAEKAEAAARAALAGMEGKDGLPGERALPLLELAAHVGGNAGPEAAMAAERLGLADESAFARWLMRRSYHVALIGFQPGFAYLDDLSPAGLPEIARLDRPRQRIAAGSIGFLGGRACVYAQDGPGGWPIVGRVEVRLFDPAASPPALLSAGRTIRFRIA